MSELRLNRPDVVEFWIGQSVLLRVQSSFAPDEGDLVNIAKRTYRVVGRSFAVDHSDDPWLTQVRCNVIVEPMPDQTPEARHD